MKMIGSVEYRGARLELSMERGRYVIRQWMEQNEEVGLRFVRKEYGEKYWPEAIAEYDRLVNELVSVGRSRRGRQKRLSQV